MPWVCHKPKLLSAHQWGKYAQIYATHEFAPTKDVARFTLYIQCSMTTMPWSNYITELATWEIQSKVMVS